jgi:hypothetical protein
MVRRALVDLGEPVGRDARSNVTEEERQMNTTRIEQTGWLRRDVVHITFGKHSEGVVTGVIVSQTDQETTVRMYSAGCLHGEYTVPTAEITKVEHLEG